jgi:hypothetical protein
MRLAIFTAVLWTLGGLGAVALAGYCVGAWLWR